MIHNTIAQNVKTREVNLWTVSKSTACRRSVGSCWIDRMFDFRTVGDTDQCCRRRLRHKKKEFLSLISRRSLNSCGIKYIVSIGVNFKGKRGVFLLLKESLSLTNECMSVFFKSACGLTDWYQKPTFFSLPANATREEKWKTNPRETPLADLLIATTYGFSLGGLCDAKFGVKKTTLFLLLKEEEEEKVQSFWSSAAVCNRYQLTGKITFALFLNTVG